MPTLGERSGKKPRWADLQDSTDELLSDVPPALLHVDSYDGSQSHDLDGIRRTFSQTMSNVLCNVSPLVGDPLVESAEHRLPTGKDGDNLSKKASRDSIDRRTPPRGPQARLHERLQGTPSPQVQGQVSTAKRASRRGLGTSKRPVPVAHGFRKRALETGQPADHEDEECNVNFLEGDAACHADGEETQRLERTISQATACGDEDWQRRFDKRQAIVSTTKATPQYQAHVARRAVGCPSAQDVPRTPDPSHRDVSKRSWERSVMDWRVALRTLPAGNNP